MSSGLTGILGCVYSSMSSHWTCQELPICI
jgi:hypothetical protein